MVNTNQTEDNNTVINISHLTKRFGDLVAVDNLDLRIFKGEVFGFLGPNGAGKTTTINMICGLSKPSGGEIIFQNSSKQNNSNFRTKIGICPQENIFWPKLTCREQLNFMGRMYNLSAGLSKKRTIELLELMGLKDVIPEIIAVVVLTIIYFLIGIWAFKARHMKVE